ncbi:MAG TPA: sugar phosphate nucleotidyltransferase [Terriglobia bacterium]|nr:sugar phosphate nucleotidyltransferase [Terriglobia bacterium]
MLTNSLQGTQALILAGGRGERLFPLTVFRPKPAIPFGGILRIVDFTLSNCLNSNVTRVSLLTQYRHDDLYRYIRRNWSDLWNKSGVGWWSVNCVPPTSGKHYKGTADAVFQNLPELHQSESETICLRSFCGFNFPKILQSRESCRRRS